jgi:class 3 adenylate cyclase
MSVSTLTMVATGLENAQDLYRERGDTQAAAIIHEHFRLLDECARAGGGALVKAIQNGVLMAFHDNAAAVKTALGLSHYLQDNERTRELRLGIAVHRGPTVAATLNNQLDYFGRTVNTVLQLAQQARAGQILITKSAAADPQTALLLEEFDGRVIVVNENETNLPLMDGAGQLEVAAASHFEPLKHVLAR